MTERTNTVVIGGGQAGVVTSYHLSQRNLDHVVLEQASDLFPAWRSRWDSFTLVTPNFQLQMPELPYEGDDPDGFLPRHEVIEHLVECAASFDPPVRFGVRATSVERNPAGGYLRGRRQRMIYRRATTMSVEIDYEELMLALEHSDPYRASLISSRWPSGSRKKQRTSAPQS